MKTWHDWKIENKDNIEHPVGFEEKFVDDILMHLPGLTPDDIISQYPFRDFKGKSRQIDFMIINDKKGYLLPIELDGYSKLQLDHGYDRFNDFLERQNALIAKFGIVLRYTNKKMIYEAEEIIKEIQKVLQMQSEHKSIELVKNTQVQSIISDYENQIKELVIEINSKKDDAPNSEMTSVSNTLSSIQEEIKKLKDHIHNNSVQEKTETSPFPPIKYPTPKKFIPTISILIGGIFILSSITFGSIYLFKPNQSTEINQKQNQIDSKSISTIPKSTSEITHPTTLQPETTIPVIESESQYKFPNTGEASVNSREYESRATPTSSENNTISIYEVSNFIGESKKVCGSVAQIKTFNKGTYINFGNPYPNENFTAVIWSSDSASIGDVDHLNDQDICIQGKITTYKGKPQMIIQTSQQIN